MRAVLFLLAGVAVCAGCATPRIIVLNDPLDARQHNDLGVSYQSRGEFDLAVREYERAADLDSDWDRPLINRGNVFALQNRWREAEASYRKALRRRSENAEAMNNLAWALLQQKKLPDALDWSKKAVAREPRQPVYLDTLAEIYMGLGKTDAAEQTLQRALACAPQSPLRETLEDKLRRLEKDPGSRR